MKGSYKDLMDILEKLVSQHPYILLGVDQRERIIYYTNEGGFASIWIYDQKENIKKRITDYPILWASDVSRDLRRLVFTRDIGKGRELQHIGEIDLLNDKVKIYDNIEPMRIFSFAVDEEKIVFTGATMKDIGLYMIKRDTVEKLAVMPAFASVNDVREDLIVGSGVLMKNPKSSELFIYNISTNNLEILTPKEGSVNRTPIILSDRKILFQSNYQDPDRMRLVELDPEARLFREKIFDNKDLERYDPVEYIFMRDFNDKILVIGKREGRSRIFVDGVEINTLKGMILGAFLFKDRIYYTYTNIYRPARVIIYENGVNREVVGSRVDEDLEKRFGDVEFTYIRSLDGLKIPVYIARSNIYDQTKTGVVYIHGGPWSEVADSWSIMIASLVAMGFNVIAPNFRGSTGYGESFRLLDIGDPGGGDLLDIEASAKYALENKLGEKLFVMGYSYGGYMTLWTMFNKPEFFECGVAGAAVADWEEMYDLSDAVFRSFIDILFDNKRHLLKERSPITKAENLSKPLCIIQPQNDTRTPLKPVMKLAMKLLENGKSFEMHIIPDMGHIVSSIDDAVKILLPAMIFFRRCVEKNR